MFNKKQCKQCGWELKLFTKQSFCSGECASLYDSNKREYEASLKKQSIHINIDLKS